MSDATSTEPPAEQPTAARNAEHFAKVFKADGMSYPDALIALRRILEFSPEVSQKAATEGHISAELYSTAMCEDALKTAGFTPVDTAASASSVADPSAPSQELKHLVTSAIEEGRIKWGIPDNKLPAYVAEKLESDDAWLKATLAQQKQAIAEALGTNTLLPAPDKPSSELMALVKPAVKSGQDGGLRDDDLYEHVDLLLARKPAWNDASDAQKLAAVKVAESGKSARVSPTDQAASVFQKAKKRPVLLAAGIALVLVFFAYKLLKHFIELVLRAVAPHWSPTEPVSAAGLIDFMKWILLGAALVITFMAIRRFYFKSRIMPILLALLLLAVAALMTVIHGMSSVNLAASPVRSEESRIHVDLSIDQINACKTVAPNGLFADVGSARSCGYLLQNKKQDFGTIDKAGVKAQSDAVFTQVCRALFQNSGQSETRSNLKVCVENESKPA